MQAHSNVDLVNLANEIMIIVGIYECSTRFLSMTFILSFIHHFYYIIIPTSVDSIARQHSQLIK